MTQANSRGAWRVEADTLSEMHYDSYRHTHIHETTDIKDFLSPGTEGTTLVAPKGYGKTLLLIAKKKSFLDAKSFSGIIMAENVFIDRPTGAFRIWNREHINQLAEDYEFWKSIWKITIALAAVKAWLHRANTSLKKIGVEVNHDWHKRMLRDESRYFEAGELFTDLLAQDYATIMRVIETSNFLFPILTRINTPIVFFIDNVDEYFRPVLEDHSPHAHSNMVFRNRNNNIWTLAQLALTSGAYELGKNNHHIKIFCTMRHEAFLRMSEVESDAFQIAGSGCLEIKYTSADLERIFLKNIELTADDRVVEPRNQDLMGRFVGSQNTMIVHRFVPERERAFDYFLRHTLYRPRDLMYIGGEISKIPPAQRTPKNIQSAVDASTKTIVDSIFAEMRPFFAVPERSRLLPQIPSNVLSIAQLKDATSEYLHALGSAVADPEDEVSHPFCVLQNLGLLGVVNREPKAETTYLQSFLQPTQITVGRHLGLTPSQFYLLHPALDLSVYEASSTFARLYHTQNIIGNERKWRDPVTSLFVLRGDMINYSSVMSSDLYEIVTRKLHEWAQGTCRNVHHVDVSAGDSILLVDPNPVKLIECARALLSEAAAFHEHPMKMRFGGAAGPVTFERISRLHDGKWDELLVPLGMALRVSARLEPYARPGHILIDEKFCEAAYRATATSDGGPQDSTRTDGLGEISISPLYADDVPGLMYDQSTGRFVVQKNSADPPYHTKLWQIAITDPDRPVGLPAASEDGEGTVYI